MGNVAWADADEAALLVDAVAFERARPYISAALEHAGGTHDPDDIRDGVRDGRFQLWPGDRSAIVTEILVTPRRRTLHLFLAGGDLRELEAMLPPILEWARSINCTHASLVGRHGWQRTFLARDGWRPTATVMETVL